MVAWRTKEDASIEYNVIYDNKDIEWQCLSVDDYGAKFYEGAVGWVASQFISNGSTLAEKSTSEGPGGSLKGL